MNLLLLLIINSVRYLDSFIKILIKVEVIYSAPSEKRY